MGRASHACHGCINRVSSARATSTSSAARAAPAAASRYRGPSQSPVPQGPRPDERARGEAPG
eukprot:14377334-Alexandrium_andersonii.AAC.1